MAHCGLLSSAAPLALMLASVQAQASDLRSDLSGQNATPAALVGQSPAAQQPAAPTEQAPVSDTDQASDASNDTAASSVQDSQAAANDVVVTGFRASLANAQAIKRNSDAILDAIVAEDIGKLPDNTAAESVARVPGIQVVRVGDEVREVLVRGLPDLVTTFNGRDIYTAELRRSQLQDFPAGALAGLEVYKSGTADLLEPGLAGLINVRTRRAFDFNKPFTVAGGFRGTYNDQSKKYDPNGNLLVSIRRDTSIGEIGILVNGSYNQSRYRNAVRLASNVITALGSTQPVNPASAGRAFRYPDRVAVNNPSGKRVRPSGNMSVQWKPNKDLEVYYDFLFQGFRQDGYNDQFDLFLRAAGPTLNDVVLRDGYPDQVESFTKVGGDRAAMFRSTTKSYTNTFQNALGFKWQAGRARISADLAYTRSEYGIDEWSFDTATTSAPTANVNFFADGGAAFSLPGFRAEDPNNYKWRGYFERTNRVQGKGWQGRTDVDLDTDMSFLPKLQFGFRWSDRDGSLRNGTRYAFTERLNIPLASLGLGDLAVTQDAFRSDVQGWRGWLMPTRGAIVNNAAKLRQLAIQGLQQQVPLYPTDPQFTNALALFQTPNVQLDPYAGFSADETTYAVYGQGRYNFAIGSWDIDGLFGVRVVNTIGQYRGISRISRNGVIRGEQRSTDANYVDVLPNFSLRVRPVDRLQLRFGVTKTRTKPEFGALNPAISITQRTTPAPADAPLDPRFPAGLNTPPDATGSGGNPNLVPLTSTNYDLTAEYYFSRTASVTASVFYRDLFGFFANYPRRFIDPVFGLVETTSPENAGAGNIKGAEIAGQTFFDFLPGALSGFGVSGNVTYLEGELEYPAALSATGGPVADPPIVNFPNLSKWNYNASVFYERSGFSARLSYNYRGPFLTGNFIDAAGVYVGEGVRNITRLDYFMSYNPIPQLTVTLDATNLLARPFRNFYQYGEDRAYARDVRDEGRYFGIGTRFRF